MLIGSTIIIPIVIVLLWFYFIRVVRDHHKHVNHELIKIRAAVKSSVSQDHLKLYHIQLWSIREHATKRQRIEIDELIELIEKMRFEWMSIELDDAISAVANHQPSIKTVELGLEFAPSVGSKPITGIKKKKKKKPNTN